MAIENGDIVRITCKFRQSGNAVQNVYHARVTTTGSVPDSTFLTEMAAEMDDMYTDITSEIADTVSFSSIEIYNVTGETYVGETGWPSKTTGTNTADQLPPQTAPLVLFNTNVLRSQGRKFLPPYTETGSDDFGKLATVALSHLLDFIVDVLAAKTGTNWSAVLGNYNYPLERFAQWISGVARAYFATQRRRYIGVGE